MANKKRRGPRSTQGRRKRPKGSPSSDEDLKALRFLAAAYSVVSRMSKSFIQKLRAVVDLGEWSLLDNDPFFARQVEALGEPMLAALRLMPQNPGARALVTRLRRQIRQGPRPAASLAPIHKLRLGRAKR